MQHSISDSNEVIYMTVDNNNLKRGSAIVEKQCNMLINCCTLHEQEDQLMQKESASKISIEMGQNAPQMVEELHLKSPATGEWPSTSFKVTDVGAIWKAIYDCLL